ncbi:YcaO-like family protein [Amaricoccus sp.]|uniref:YcaO-like family protein n=1 Tax=Amaricoccus sp. TaxID=1872485 RepID=UPI002627E964|nr:YcaO-like family protein [Amaricoccus sp.]HRO10679.1 YcaO-like family protein [Amaricoccus sp.]
MHMIPPAALADLLATPTAAPPPIEATVRRLWARRARFGITRLGALTGLDRAGVPVAQVIRPLARSNAVTQGKGATLPEAAIAALMESLETWAAERIPPERTWRAPPDDTDLWADLCRRAPDPAASIAWIEGWDLLAARPRPVPLALVDTVYTLPSPHPAWLPRDTSGLAAGTDLQGALRHACLELLEREARHRALAMPHFFDRFRIAAASVAGARSAPLLDRLRRSPASGASRLRTACRSTGAT